MLNIPQICKVCKTNQEIWFATPKELKQRVKSYLILDVERNIHHHFSAILFIAHSANREKLVLANRQNEIRFLQKQQTSWMVM